MKSMLIRFVCRVLIASLICLPLQAQAELIATNHAVSAAKAQSARAAIAVQLEALGITADGARERVTALTDAEALQLAGRVGEAPAGAVIEWGLLFLAIFLIWRFGFSDQAKAEQKASQPQKEPAKK